MAYRVSLTPTADGQLADSPQHVQKCVVRWLELVGREPRRKGTTKLKGRDDLRRVHASRDYVVLYRVDDSSEEVLVARIAHRSEAYRRLPVKPKTT